MRIIYIMLNYIKIMYHKFLQIFQSFFTFRYLSLTTFVNKDKIRLEFRVSIVMLATVGSAIVKEKEYNE